MKWEILISFCPFLMVVVAFILFVYWNGSIVLGNIHFLVFPGDDLFGSLRGPKDPLSHTYPILTLQVQKKHTQLPHIFLRCFILVWFLYWLRLLCISLSPRLWTCFVCFGRVGPFYSFRCSWPL